MRTLATAAVAAAVLLGGCLEREELVRVDDDGGVTIKVRWRSNSHDELYFGDAAPNLHRGWIVQDFVELDGENRETFRLEAEQYFAPEEPLPADFTAPDEAYAESMLRFPTTLELEERRDGTYYHFRRVYRPRQWAQHDAPRQLVLEQAEQLQERDFEDLSESERRTLIDIYARAQLIRYRALLRQSLLDVTPDAPQDVWLDLAASLEPLVATLDHEAIVAVVLAGEDAEAAEDQPTVDELIEAFETQALEAAVEVLRGSGWYPATMIKTFEWRYRTNRRTLEITEGHADDKFRIAVEMPGEIIGHNGEATGANTVEWEFGGAMLRDRVVELMVTSRK